MLLLKKNKVFKINHTVFISEYDPYNRVSSKYIYLLIKHVKKILLQFQIS